jgi:RNA recognition motif-containing protein
LKPDLHIGSLSEPFLCCKNTACFLNIYHWIMNIFVTKLNFSTSAEGLQAAFEAFGEVSSAVIITDKMTGRSKGYGFVEMPDDALAASAIQALDGSDLDGRTIVVRKAEPREDRGDSRGPRHGGGGGYR